MFPVVSDTSFCIVVNVESIYGLDTMETGAGDGI